MKKCKSLKRPILTITMPVYNVERYLKRGIESVLGQKFNDFELIIVDDGSTDNSGNICDYYANLDDRVRVIHQDNQGLVAAREVALNIANGEYIGFVDPDDWVEYDFFEKLIEGMKQTDADVVIGGYVLEYEVNSKVKNRFNNSQMMVISRDEGIENLFTHKLYQWELWDKIYRKEVIENISINKKIKCGEDLLRVYHAFCKSNKICVLPLYGYHYVQRCDSMTRSKIKNYEDTVFYAMSTLDEVIDRENEVIKNAFKMRKNRFLLIEIIEMLKRGNVADKLVKELYKQYIEIIFGNYPIRFKLISILMFFMFKIKRGNVNENIGSSL
ncbi:MAG: glycosyltransferase family 2 protein [Selenomonas ruminantium]|uniref:Glycosyltransferase family 2 protein n=1 Tax=Selenomonas ruminantium TaxID=971 RepID=A0A927ZS24_SELRU|nr:glycosyltransferase family 2 protein [Selenomonas ruminantium]